MAGKRRYRSFEVLVQVACHGGPYSYVTDAMGRPLRVPVYASDVNEAKRMGIRAARDARLHGCKYRAMAVDLQRRR